MTREDVKNLFRNDKDSYGKPRGIMSKIDQIFDWFESRYVDVVYEFVYTSSICEGARNTVSIHRTRKGAEKAMEAHKLEIKRKFDIDEFEYNTGFNFDFDQYWEVKKTKLKE